MANKSKKEEMIPCTIISKVKQGGKWRVKETNQGKMPANLSKTRDKRFTTKKAGTVATYWRDGSYHVQDYELGTKTSYIPKKG